MRLDKKIDKAMFECYSLLYEHSTPSANFQELMDNAEINQFGQKVIDFDSYCLEQDKFDQLMNSVIKKYKFNGYLAKRFRATIYLGCSPRFKK